MQQDNFGEVDSMGKRLSLLLGCTIGLDSWGRNVFVCGHGVPFSVTKLMESSNWSWAKEKHEKEVKK